jgi:hypothetical protein
MTNFDLPNNYTKDLEALLRKKRSHASSSSATPPIDELVNPAPSGTPIMAKTFRDVDYSIPAVANVSVGPTINIGNRNFELRTGLILMV